MFLFSHITDTQVALVTIMCPDPPADSCSSEDAKPKPESGILFCFPLASDFHSFTILNGTVTPSLRSVANWKTDTEDVTAPTMLSEMEQVLIHALNFQFISRDPFPFQSLREQPHRRKNQ